MPETADPPPTIFLGPREIVIAAAPVRVKTVLGSCVAISMHARRLGWTAITHCFLPRAGAPLRSLQRAEALTYVDTAIELMWREAARRGASLEDLEVKLFGGAESVILNGSHPFQVGSMNVEAAEQSLAALGLSLAARSTGGRGGMLIELECGTGQVLVRNLSSARTGAIQETS